MSTRFRFVGLFLIASAAFWGETNAGRQQPQSAAGKPAANTSSVSRTTIGPSTPVITIAGICDRASSQASACTTVITREEFERLAQLVEPGMTAADRQRFAILYSQLLVFANAAQQRELDKTADAQQALHFAQLQALSQVLARKLQTDVSKASPDAIQKYHHEHPKQFEEATLLRLYVPRGQQGDGKFITEEDAQAEIKKLRERASRGENFELLQKQAYAHLGIAGSVPPTELKKVRREGLSSGMSSVFDLPLGALSEPISETNGLYVLRMASKRELSVQEATPEIVSLLQNRRMQQALEEISASTKASFNAEYFDEAPKTASTNPSAAMGLPVPRNSAGANGASVNGNSTPPPQ